MQSRLLAFWQVNDNISSLFSCDLNMWPQWLVTLVFIGYSALLQWRWPMLCMASECLLYKHTRGTTATALLMCCSLQFCMQTQRQDAWDSYRAGFWHKQYCRHMLKWAIILTKQDYHNHRHETLQYGCWVLPHKFSFCCHSSRDKSSLAFIIISPSHQHVPRNFSLVCSTY